MSRVLRFTGWTLIGAGAVALLYLAYSLFYTGLESRRAQAELGREWALDVRGAGQSSAANVPLGEPERVEAGQAVAVLQFTRPGATKPLVHDGPLYVIEGTGVEDLKKGPGRYTGTAMPGQPGNFAVAGHRTTYGHPFFDLDDLQPGDKVLVTDRRGARWVYSVVRQQIVTPSAGFVLGSDPIGLRRPMLTLTTCHPRFSKARRLIVFAELTNPTGGQT
ncbi:MAG: class E sortase [Egibacteraceae bacterium]